MHVTYLELAILTFSAFGAGIMDIIAGGGGLITMPALLLFGMPPALALGTNKLQGTFGTLSASLYFIRKGHVDWRDLYVGMLYTIFGTSLGTLTVLWMSSAALEKIIPVLLIGVLVYMIVAPKMGDTDRPPLLPHHGFYFLFGIGLGFYDGFFGPGTGTFWALSLVLFLGMNLQRATMHAKFFNFSSNIAALAWFIWAGHIDYTVGLCMAAGQFCGGRIGAHLVAIKGIKLIRPVFFTVVALMIASLIYKLL